MYHAKSAKDKLRLFLTIMWPILVTQVGYNAMTLFDTIMSGRAGTADLAGVAIGSSLWMPAYVALTGVLIAVTPTVSQLVGAGRIERIAPSVTQAFYMSAIIAAFVYVAGALALDPILSIMKLDADVHDIAKRYLVALSYGILPLFLSGVIRNYFDAQGYTRITMAIVLFAVPCNIVLNYVLIFGKLGFPAMGGVGAGYATAATYWLIFLISGALCFRLEAPRAQGLFRRWPKPSLRAFKELLAIGVPIGLSIFFEASIFSVVTLLMGTSFDTVTIASHQAAISFSALLFMMPLSISMALTIMVGYEIGAGRTADARQYSIIGVAAAVSVVAAMAVVVYFNRGFIASWFTEAPEVAAMTKHFLIYAIFFQLSDASQASLQGALRGYKDVTVPFVTALIAYWIIGIPAGYALSWTALGPYGFWIGITAGLTFAAVGFAIRLRLVQRRAQLPSRGA
ncbi:MATE family efflux transporter [Paenibacillus sp.]|uniref:MATE family efflux transporter n=1 Tax=Paenibacillus sp. TaxID=58172 RepID=UPI00281271B4|nr:MATE family efflux transporter [Paenibacillus sp.]